MSLLDDMATKLETDNVTDGVTGWTTKKSHMPPAPDKIVGLFDVGGAGDVDQTQGVNTFDEYGFQVRVRAPAFDYEVAASKLAEVFTSLNDATIADYVFVFSKSIQPIPLGLDDNDRPELVMNFLAMKKR